MTRSTTARVAWGIVLMTWPGLVLAAISGHRPTPTGRRLLRVLGARHLLQATIGNLRPTPAVLGLGAAIDGLHAATCLGFALLDPTWRLAALIDGCAATAIGVSAFRCATRR